MNEDVAALVERMEKFLCHPDVVGDDQGRCAFLDLCQCPTEIEAIAALQAQAAEIDRLKEELGHPRRDQWLKTITEHSNIRHAATNRARAAEAKLREAVEWVREARKWCQEGLSGQHERLAEQALERIHEATGDFLATMEKPND